MLEEHLSATVLAAAVEGRLTPWERHRVLRHLAACPSCAEEWAMLYALLREANSFEPPSSHPLEHVAKGIGSFVSLFAPAEDFKCVLVRRSRSP